VLSPTEYAEILVVVAHPWGDIEVPLRTWVEKGPGPRRFVGITAAKRRSTGEDVPLSEVPMEYHNSPESRRLQREGRLPCPWGPPPDEL
jgi:hypothetical protein